MILTTVSAASFGPQGPALFFALFGHLSALGLPIGWAFDLAQLGGFDSIADLWLLLMVGWFSLLFVLVGVVTVKQRRLAAAIAWLTIYLGLWVLNLVLHAFVAGMYIV